MKFSTNSFIIRRPRIARTYGIASLLLALLVFNSSLAQVKNVVLVHGAWADGSGWEGVYKSLVAKGYQVSVVGNSDISLTNDVKSTRAVLARQKGPVILVGHSYGGAIITQAGDTANVVGLVYVSAFVPDKDESLLKIMQAGPQDPNSPILPPSNGFLWIDKAKFHPSFCADLPAAQAAFMANSQVPLGMAAVTEELSVAAWRTKPSWYVLSKQDKMIPPDAQRSMAKRAKATITEINTSHCGYISRAADVAAVIEKAALAASK